MSERALVARLLARVGPAPAFIALGIGDDAAVVAPERGAHDVLTTDSLVEDVHFRRAWTPPDAIGHKALAVNLSDLAAMGATPRASLLSLALPDAFTLGEFDALVDGFVSLAKASGAHLIGGNLTRSPGPLMVDVTVLGAAHPRRILRRAGARAGHDLYVTGTLGAAAAGLGWLEAGGRPDGANQMAVACVERYERPMARLRCGRIVARSAAASAAIDLSDGLADAARRLAEAAGRGIVPSRAAGLGVVIDAAAVPVDPGARAWATRAGLDPVRLALEGGEDYELAFAVAPSQRRRFAAALGRSPDLPVTCVGRFVAEPGAWLDQDGQRVPLGAGFSHF